MFCHYLCQEVGLILPHHESRLALLPIECGRNDTKSLTLVLSLTSYTALNKLLNHAGPWFPHIQKGTIGLYYV